MPLHTPDGVVAPEWADLARKVTDGDGLGWPGDPRLSLSVGTLVAKRGSQTVATGRRLEVWRHNEDGTDTLVAHWQPSEQHRVCYDLARMRVDSPGHVDVNDAIDKHNDALEAKHSADLRDILGQMIDHSARLHHDLNNPRNVFYMNGAKNRGGRA